MRVFVWKLKAIAAIPLLGNKKHGIEVEVASFTSTPKLQLAHYPTVIPAKAGIQR